MAGDLIMEVRRAVLARLKADADLTALVPAKQIYPSTVPADPEWPFGRFDGPQSLPLDGNCFRGATVTFMYHFFARPRLQGIQVVETAEDHCARIASAAKLCLHERRVPVADASARLRVVSVRLMPDGAEASAYHAILPVEARAIVT